MAPAPKGAVSQGCWVILDGQVLVLPDRVMDEHPGGRDVIASLHGRDVTQDFADAGHSDSALQWALSFRVEGTAPRGARSGGGRARPKEVADEEPPAWMVVALGMVSLTSAMMAWQLRKATFAMAR